MKTSEKLLEYRARLNMSQARFLAWLRDQGVAWNHSSLSRAERGKTKPAAKIWKQIELVCEEELKS